MSISSSSGRNFKQSSSSRLGSSFGSVSSVDSTGHYSYSRSSSLLPTPVPYRHGCMTAAAKRYKFLRRLVKFRQMDFEFAAWQMVYLFTSPQKVFRNFQYRKQTKAQFARDDPAFMVLLCFWLAVTSIGFALTLHLGVFGFLRFLLYTIFIDTLTTGVVVATILWAVTNHYMVRPTCRDDDVEWGYAFDVHLNAFFPSLIILHLIQLLFYSYFLSLDLFISRFVGNALWVLAISYYIYITFLGYSALPILRHTRIFLFAIPVLMFLFLVSLLLGWNLCSAMIHFYQYRVL